MQFDYNFFQLKKQARKTIFEQYLNRKPLNRIQMFLGKGCDGLTSTTLRRGKRRETDGVGGGGGEPQKHIKVYKGVGGIKLVNIERTHFLNGPHPKIVDFIYFNENPLKMMNVPYLI